MWPGPVDFDGHVWPTREHAIINVKLGATSEIPVSKICDDLMEYADTNPLRAKKFGQVKSKSHLLEGRHSIHLEAVLRILLSAVFTDVVFLHCFLDPSITAFVHM